MTSCRRTSTARDRARATRKRGGLKCLRSPGQSRAAHPDAWRPSVSRIADRRGRLQALRNHTRNGSILIGKSAHGYGTAPPIPAYGNFLVVAQPRTQVRCFAADVLVHLICIFNRMGGTVRQPSGADQSLQHGRPGQWLAAAVAGFGDVSRGCANGIRIAAGIAGVQDSRCLHRRQRRHGGFLPVRTPPFMQAQRADLLASGVTADRIHREVFGQDLLDDILSINRETHHDIADRHTARRASPVLCYAGLAAPPGHFHATASPAYDARGEPPVAGTPCALRSARPCLNRSPSCVVLPLF